MERNYALYIPEKAEKEITFMLFNINNIDTLIKKRKEEYYDSVNVSNREYLKSLKHENSNTLENVIAKIDDDYWIKRYKQFRTLILTFIKDISNDNEIDYIYNELFKDKYINKYKEKEIEKKFKFSIKQIKEMDMLLKWIIYHRAITYGIYEKEGVNE